MAKRGVSLATFLASFAYTVITAFFLALTTVALGVNKNGGRNLAIFWCSLPLLFWVALFIHECGHAVAAKLARMQVSAFSVWPVILYRVGTRFRWRWRFRARGQPLGYVAAVVTRPTGIIESCRTLLRGGADAGLFVLLGCVLVGVFLNKPSFWTDLEFARFDVPIWRHVVPQTLGSALFFAGA